MRYRQGLAPVDNRTVLRIAREAIADPQTIRKVIHGQPVRGKVAIRIQDALRDHGIPPNAGALMKRDRERRLGRP